MVYMGAHKAANHILLPPCSNGLLTCSLMHIMKCSSNNHLRLNHSRLIGLITKGVQSLEELCLSHPDSKLLRCREGAD